MRAIDVSIYSGEISVDQWRKIKADGYGLAIVGLFHGRSTNPYAAQQMRTAHEAGMLLAGYVLIAPWTGDGGWRQVAWGLEAAEESLLSEFKFVAVDCEIDGISMAMIASALGEVQDTLLQSGLRPIIYTGWWWWYGHFNDSRAFSHIPLWAADYDGEANLDTRMYGGWTKAVGKQYAGTTMLHGVNCDLNFFDDEFLKEEEVPGIDWPVEKLKLFNTFLAWWDVFPESQEQKDGLEETRRRTGTNMEERWYRDFYEEQIVWRSPPR